MTKIPVYPLAAVMALILLPNAPAQTARDTILTMSDGVQVDALYCIPNATPPYPAIIFVHGFGGSKENHRTDAVNAARSGYVGVAYSVRGQGASGGEFDFFTSERIIGDLRAVVDFTKSLPGVNTERVAVVGGSQGGIHAWAAAAHDLGIRTAVSVVANGRFDEDWAENNALNWTFFATVTTTSVRLVPALKDSITRAGQTGDVSGVRTLLEGYSTRPLEPSVTTPVLILVSYHDGFFNPAAALRQVGGLPPATRRRIVLYPGGHSLPSDVSIRLACSILQEQWLEFWLRDETVYAPVASPDSAVVLFDGATKQPRIFALTDSAYWLAPPQDLPAGLEARTWYFNGDVLSENPPTISGQRVINYVNLIGSTPVSWQSAPLSEAVTLACLPPRAVLYCDGTGTMYQMELQLWDYDPAAGQSAPISRGHFQVPENQPGVEALTFGMTPILYTIAAGHQLEARLHAGIPVIPNLQNSFGNFVLGPPVASSNTLFWNTQQPSHFTILLLKESATPVDRVRAVETVSLGAPWPNPAGAVSGTTSTSVRFPYFKGLGPARLQILDCLGRSMGISRDLPEPVESGSVILDVSGYAPGMYHAVLTGPRQRAVRPFTVIR